CKTGGSKLPEAAPADDLVRIHAADDHPANARPDHRVRAWRRAALVRVRLERHVRRRASRFGSCRGKRDGFGVRSAGSPIVSACDLAIAAHENAADGGIRRRPAESELGLGDGFTHPFFVDLAIDVAFVDLAIVDLNGAASSGRVANAPRACWCARFHSLPPRLRSLTRFSTVRWNSAMSRNER